MSARDEPALPPELAELGAIAAAADAQLDGAAELQAGQPPAPEVDETAEVAGMLSLVVMILGKAVPPVSDAYTPEACGDIATQYMRCAEEYGWTFHKQLGSPIAGLVAALAMPAVVNLDKFAAWSAAKRAAAVEARRSAQPPSLVTTPAHVAAH